MLLYRQDELAVLERDLIKLDADDAKHRPLALKSRKRDEETDNDPVYSRKVLIQKIDDKLKQYGQYHLLMMMMTVVFHQLTIVSRRSGEPTQDLPVFESSHVTQRKDIHRLDRGSPAPYGGGVQVRTAQGRLCGALERSGKWLAGWHRRGRPELVLTPWSNEGTIDIAFCPSPN